METSWPLSVAQSNSSSQLTTGYQSISNSWATTWKAFRMLVLISAFLTVVLNPGALTDGKRLAFTFIITFAYSAGLWFVNWLAVEWLNTHISWAERPLRRILVTVALQVGGSVLVVLVIQAAYLLLSHQSLALLWRPQMYGQVLIPLGITIIISLFNHSRSFFLNWREAAIRVERVEKENAVARLDSLRRQVDPHFLFNSLNALTSLIEEEDPARASRFVRQLAKVYRYVLDSQEQEVVTLAEEMRFVEAYVYLQRTRLGEGLQVEINLPLAANLEELLVPPLAVQLLLENALKHNATSQKQPLYIHITLDAAARQLVVRNALRYRRVPDEESTGLGLPNLSARYAFLTSRPVTVTKTETEFTVTLPLLEVSAL
ncbi:sensor histidine kinase [Hymenobacter volaticus]|uniref:Histidine kinase n=1 Tax=Hymenobacter volaticus TaxID=2932254 RepID=A0ABY4G2I2_9BACT|nr:histidine kinase [Hymenobacter volaticus]UOQ65028.1 histidine kinase [Hymenobacter volaticus]